MLKTKLLIVLCFFIPINTITDPEALGGELNQLMPKNIYYEIINYAINVFSIYTIDSNKSNQIRSASALRTCLDIHSGFKNMSNMIGTWNRTSKINKLNENDIVKYTFIALYAWSTYHDYEHLKFDLKTFRKAKKMAKFNKSMKLNLRNEKIRQVIWFTFNRLLPKLFYPVKNLIYPKPCYTDEDQIKYELLPLLGVCILADLSEKFRHQTLNKKIQEAILKRIRGY